MQAAKLAYTAIFILGVVFGIIVGQNFKVEVARAYDNLDLPVNWATIENNRLIFDSIVQNTNFYNVSALVIVDPLNNTIVEDLISVPGFLYSNQPSGGYYAADPNLTFGYGITRLSGTFGTIKFGTSYSNAINDPLYTMTVQYTGGNVTRVFGGATSTNNITMVILNPSEYGTTTATNNVLTKVYYLNDQEIATTTRAEYRIYDAVTDELEYTTFQLVPAGNMVNFNLENNINLATGSKKMIAKYVIASNDLDLISPKETFFNVINNSYLDATGLISPVALPSDLTQIDCNTFDVGCQFQKAISFLFIPPQTSLDKFSSLWRELSTLKPFGYITQIIEQLKTINGSAAGAYTLPAVPFVDTIFAPFKSVLAIMLWGIFAFVFYRRIKNIEI